MTDRIARVWNGSDWEAVTSTAAAPNAVALYQSASPSIPITGQIWMDSDDNTIYFWDGSSWTSVSTGDTGGTVTSVGVSVPTGLSVSGTPVTTSGTVEISLASGYSIPTTSSQTNWDTAYSDRLKWDGGSTGLTASTGRTSLGATTVGSNLFTLTNPSAIRFLRINADNTVSSLDAATFRTAIGAGTSSTVGTVTSVAVSVPTGLSVSGSPITSSGTLAISLASGYEIPTTAALAAKAPLSSPTFTGTPNAPTASVGTNTTQIATTAYVQNELLSITVQPTLHPMFIIGGV